MKCLSHTCLSHTLKCSHLVCAVETSLGINQKIFSITRDPMLNGFLTVSAQTTGVLASITSECWPFGLVYCTWIGWESLWGKTLSTKLMYKPVILKSYRHHMKQQSTRLSLLFLCRGSKAKLLDFAKHFDTSSWLFCIELAFFLLCRIIVHEWRFI